MATPTPCPDPAALERFLLGLSPEPEAQAIARHFLDCPACQVTAAPAEDSLLRALRRPDGTDAETEPGDEAVVRRLRDGPGPAETYHVEGYRLLRPIGRGGMGVVFEAEDERLHRRVAVKVLAGHLAGDAAAQERFLREARAAAAIQSDHVVAIHQVGLARDAQQRPVPYLVMPLLAGESLDRACRREPRMAIEAVVRLGAEAANGLAAAHAAGLVHRDVKPANLWLEAPDGRVKILDFGLAQRRDDAPALTGPGVVVGTLAYLAPEQAAGERVDPRADLFGLGCVLYLLCTGRPAFGGATAVEVLSAVANHHPPPAHTVRPEVPRPLSRLIGRLLEKSPAKRPASAAAVEAELRAMLPGARPRPAWRGVVWLAGVLAVGLGLGGWFAWPPPPGENADASLPPATVPPEPEPAWVVAVGLVAVQDADAAGKPWDTTLLFGDRAAPDLFVEVERTASPAKDRLRELTEAARPLASRQAFQRNVASRVQELAKMDPADPRVGRKEKELADLKARHPPLDADEAARLADLEKEIAALRPRVLHATPVVRDTLRADFNSGALPVAAGETLEVRVWDSDGLALSQAVGKTRVVVTEEMLARGAATLEAFGQVVSLELRFRAVEP